MLGAAAGGVSLVPLRVLGIRNLLLHLETGRQSVWEQSVRSQISNSFLAARWASRVARCFTFGKLFHPSVPWFPTPKRSRGWGVGCWFYSVLAALEIVLERSHGEPWLGSLSGVWLLSGLSFQVV